MTRSTPGPSKSHGQAGLTSSTRDESSRCATPSLSRHRPAGGTRGFTLLEVLIAVAILSISLTSLLSSQMQAMRATRYAQGVTTAAFLAEQQLLEIEWEMKQDGWGDNDKEFEGDFSEEGWPDITYTCLADMIELPDYTALQAAAEAADTDGAGGGGVGTVDVQDAGEQAFDTLGMVWPMVKAAIEQSIRKASCKVVWMDGNVEHDFEVMTFWTDPTQLTQLPQLGGEAGEGDDVPGEDGGGGGAGGGQSGGGGGGQGGITPPSRGGSTRPSLGPGLGGGR